MSATNKTTYYDLPIFIGTDVPSWLGDWNNAMNAIDAGINGVKNAADNAQSTANSADNKVDAQAETISGLTKELNTMKEAVMNYDQILDFSETPIAITANNLSTTYGGAYLSQNSNKTLAKAFLLGKFNGSISKLVSYNYNSGSGSATWIDFFTAEDNCFNLTQASQPGYNNALTVGVINWVRIPSAIDDGASPVVPRFLRAWYDGATTHFGADFNPADVGQSLKYIVNSYVYGNFSVFLTGSIYNPVNPGEN